jgi:trigger factor
MSEVNQEVQKPESEKLAAQVEGGAAEEKEDDGLPQAVITIEEAGAARKRIKMDIPPERIKAKLEESFKDLQRDAVIQGFRRGRAPRRLIEKRFGSNIRDTVKQQLVAEAYQKALEDYKLEVLGDPDTDLSKFEMKDGETFVVTLEVEIAPEFELPSIEKIAVKRPKLEATDERLNLAVENLRKYFGHWHDATDGATEKDTVTADVKVTAADDGTIVAEQAGVGFQVVAEGETNIAGIKFASLTEQLKGAKLGGTIVIDGTLPEDHPDEKHRGKAVKIALDVKTVKHQDLPEVNAEFATMLGFDDVESLKADLKERLVVQLEQETKGAVAQQVYRYLLSNTNLDLPAKLSQRQMGTVLRRRATELMQKGVPEAEIVQQIDALRISSAQQAAVDLRLFFIMSKLADQFDIDVSEEEVNARIAAIAMQYGRRPEKLRGQMSASGQLEQLHLQIRDGKVVDKLVEMGEVTEVDEKTLAEEFKNLPPLSNVGPNVMGVSQAAKK